MWPLGSRATAVRAAGRSGFPNFAALRIVLPHRFLAVMSHEVVAVRQAAGVADIGMAAVGPFRQQPDLFDHLALGRQLDQPPAVALADKRIAVGEPLASVDLALRVVLERDLLLARDFPDAKPGIEQQVAIGQDPQVVAGPGWVLPGDLAVRPHQEHLLAGVVRAGKRFALDKGSDFRRPRLTSPHPTSTPIRINVIRVMLRPLPESCGSPQPQPPNVAQREPSGNRRKPSPCWHSWRSLWQRP